MGKREVRHGLIRSIVRDDKIRTQRQLVDAMAKRGVECTQATVSRDVAELGLRKMSEGVYVLAEDLHLHRMISEVVTAVAHTGNLVLVKASPGTAPGVAAALDRANLAGILGSIAGDDTVLLIAENETAAIRLQDQIFKIRGD